MIMRSWFGKLTWLTGVLISLTPILAIFFLACQIAFIRVKDKFEVYRNIPEVTSLADLQTHPPSTVVLLRGHISQATCRLFPCETAAPMADLIIYQEQPAHGREVRFQEEFQQIFPAFVLDLSDGAVAISPSLTRAHVLRHALHTVVHGDRQHSGFGIGDLVTVQAQWQPDQTASRSAHTTPSINQYPMIPKTAKTLPDNVPHGIPTLGEATGISGHDKQRSLQEWQRALQQVQWARTVLGVLTGSGMVAFLIQRRRRPPIYSTKQTTTCHRRKTTDAPTRLRS